MLNTLSQFITSNKRDGTRYMPFAFIELGVAMLSSILNSEVVIEINKRLYRRSVYNDINDDTCMQLELINQTLAELQAKRRRKKNLVIQ